MSQPDPSDALLEKTASDSPIAGTTDLWQALTSHRLAAPILSTACIIAGVFSAVHLPVERHPDLRGPLLSVVTDWPDASPEMVEQRITRLVEQSAAGLPGIRSIVSSSGEGVSSVNVTFDRGSPIEARQVEWMEQLVHLKRRLPPGSSMPEISREAPGSIDQADRFMVLSLGGEATPDELSRIAEEMVRPGLLGLKSLSDVSIHGVVTSAIGLSFDPLATRLTKTDPSLLLEELRLAGMSRTGGKHHAFGQSVPVRMDGEFTDLESLRDHPLGEGPHSRGWRLRDLAQVDLVEQPKQEIRRVSGSPSVTLHLIRQPGQDALRLAREVGARMQEINARLPGGVHLQTVHDQTAELREQLHSLYLTTLWSLAILTILLILLTRSIRVSWLILLNLLNVYGFTLTLMHHVGLSLNLYTMGGLTIALGMVLDNSIVMADRLFGRHAVGVAGLSEGLGGHALKQLLEDVRIPILAATFTTAGIMIPILFAQQELRPILIPMFSAMMIALLASIGSSFLIFPAAWWRAGGRGTAVALGPNGLVADGSGADVGHRTRRLDLLRLRWRLRPVIVFVGLSVLVVGAWSASHQKIRSDAGASRQDVIVASVQAPPGTPLRELDRILRRFEEAAMPFSDLWQKMESSASSRSGSGYVTVQLHRERLESEQAHVLFGEWMVITTTLGHVVTRLAGLGDGYTTEAGGSGSRLQYRISGHSYEQLSFVSEGIAEVLSGLRGVTGIRLYPDDPTASEDMTQIQLIPKPEAILRDGFDPDSVYALLAREWGRGDVSGTLQVGERHYPVLTRSGKGEGSAENGTRVTGVIPGFSVPAGIRIPGGYSAETSVDGFPSQRISVGEMPYRLGDWVDLHFRNIPSLITRRNQAYALQMDIGYRGAEVRMKPAILSRLSSLPLPHGVRLEEMEGMRYEESTGSVGAILLLAVLTVLTVLFILAALLENVGKAMLSLAALPFCAAGVFIGLALRGIEWSAPVLAGLLLTLGIGVNNSVLLFHQLGRRQSAVAARAPLVGGHRQRRGRQWAIWNETFGTTSRVILTTTLTTLGGLLPMILHEPGSHWSVLAETVAWGLVFGTTFLFLVAGLQVNPPE